jgi:O-antigen ligase
LPGPAQRENQAILNDRVLVASTTLLLFVVPFAGGAGTRGAALVIAVAALLLRWRESLAALAPFPRDIAVPVAAWVVLAVASVAWSVNPRFSAGELRPEILYTVAGLVVFYLAARKPAVRPWMWAAAVGTLLATLGTLLQPEWITPAVSRHPVDGGPGYLSTHLVLLAPVLFAAILAGGGSTRRVAFLAALAFAVIAGSAWETANRIVWLAFAAQVVTAVVAWRSSALAHGQRARLASAVALLCGAIAVAAFAASIVEREERVSHYRVHEGSIEADVRPRIWERAFQRFHDAPWLGHGFGREILARDFEPLTPRNMNHPLVQHAHNVFADIALELGLAGLAIFTWLLLALAVRYWRMLAHPTTVALGIAGLAVLAGFVVKNLTDDFFHRHNALAFWCVQGALLGLARGEKPERA